MPRSVTLIGVSLAALLLGGCLARTAFDVATAPVRITSRAVDLATTSQSEADETRGRELRRREERLTELQRQHDRQAARCTEGDTRACQRAEAARAEIAALAPAAP
ncbi:hypothetical protein [Hoeflea sp.]|uniref:hypothetical protein n=1 Tax=Hoeflea sp. TaxID=1940281 RepID=UPI0019C2F151|nr:hypothetical protein [Hoeflea sp.]MBC7286233.1 hypothetical protein [Hoeflea sp.]